MKSTSLSVVVLLALAVTGCNSGGGTVAAPETLEERASYAIGYGAGEGLGSQEADIDIDQLVAGLRAAFAGEDGHMTPEEMQATMMEFQQSMMAAEEELANAAGADAKAAGDAFLAENAGNAGIVVTDSGLQYEVLQEGGGASPVATDQVTVHYEGKLLDGTVFDSSYDKGAPATFPLNQVIPGWTEGVQLMSVGSKFRFFIPGELGYGLRPPPGEIGPNSTLIFEVELLSINGQS
jgi:FKBP-type peptidyl-prolyl cis-trans isomerase